MSPPVSNAPAPTGRRASWLAAPALVLLSLALLFAVALTSGDPSRLPSALIGKPAPKTPLPALAGLKRNGAEVAGLSLQDLAGGRPRLVNFFASGCEPCLQEHATLQKLSSAPEFELIGIDYKDETVSARRYLDQHGNPFARVGVDASGRAAIEWGVYGSPETFLIDPKGVIVWKHVGPLTDAVIARELKPALQKFAKAG